MNPLSIFALFLGFVTCLLIWSRVVYWAHSLWLVVRGRDRTGAMVPRDPASILVALFLHSGFWLLGLAIGGSIFIFAGPHRPEWTWFFAGAALVPPFIGINVLFVMRRVKRAKATQAI